MNQAMRWKLFVEWWREIAPKGHLYPPEILTRMVDEKVKELKKARGRGSK